MNSRIQHFLAGIASLLDIMPSRPRRMRPRSMPMTPEQIDAKAWAMVGESFRTAAPCARQDIFVGASKRPTHQEAQP